MFLDVLGEDLLEHLLALVEVVGHLRVLTADVHEAPHAASLHRGGLAAEAVAQGHLLRTGGPGSGVPVVFEVLSVRGV